MAEEKIELLDDFLVDMDIETITLDNVDNKDFIDVEETEEILTQSDENSQLDSFSQQQGIEIENLNIGGSGEGPFSVNAQTVNIYQNVSGETSIKTEEIKSVEIQQEKAQPSSQTVIKPDNISIDVKEAEIKIDESELVLNQPPEIKNFESPKPESEFIPEEEIISISEADLNEVTGNENLTDLEALGEQTQRELVTTDTGMPEVSTEEEMNLSESAEEMASIDEIEKIEEPTIPITEEFIEEASEKPQVQKTEKDEDLIVSIDGSELDNLIYGEEGLLKYTEKETERFEDKVLPEISPVESVEKVEPQPEGFEISMEEQEGIKTTEGEKGSVEEETIEEKIAVPEETIGLENIEEIRLEEISLEEEGNVVESEVSNVPVIEKEETEIENISPIEEEKEEALLAPSEVESTESKPEEEFTFDLSVIPDIAEVEEDEPIALSLDELNNIEVSEEITEYKPEVATEIPVNEEENVEIPVEEFTSTEVSIKEPASLEVYGLEGAEQPIEELEISDVENLLTEPKIRAISETGEIAIEEKIEALSPETKEELKTVLKYLDNLLENLPEDKIKEFAKSEYYDLYIKILDKLGI